MGYIKKYTRGFILVGTFFGLLISLPLILKYGLWTGLIGTLMGTLLWTAIMAVIFMPIDYFLTRKLPPEALNVRQERIIHIKGKYDKVFEKSIEILRALKSIKTIDPLKSSQSISARTKASIVSFGEGINLEFKPLSQETTEIHISSCPVAQHTILDFGKNFKNVEFISKEIQNSELGSNLEL